MVNAPVVSERSGLESELRGSPTLTWRKSGGTSRDVEGLPRPGDPRPPLHRGQNGFQGLWGGRNGRIFVLKESSETLAATNYWIGAKSVSTILARESPQTTAMLPPR